MNKTASIELNEVKALRQDFKNSKNENKFKKSLLFGYNVNETNQYIESCEANRELEKMAFQDRIKELEQSIKTLQSEKEEWESSLESIQNSVEEYENEIKGKDIQLKQNKEQIGEYEFKIGQYETKLKEREDAVVLKENISLKDQLSLAINERNDYASQCEILKNQNSFYENKMQNLEGEVDQLTEKLAIQMKTERDQIGDLSLQITKIVEGNDFLNYKVISNLEDLLFYMKSHQQEASDMTKNIKETLSEYQK